MHGKEVPLFRGTSFSREVPMVEEMTSVHRKGNRKNSMTQLRESIGPRSEDRGFTLIEVLIVIVILGILAAIVVAAVVDMTSQSSVAACRANYKTVETAQEAFRSQVGRPATAFSDLQSQTTGVNQTTVGPWLREQPVSSHYTIGFDLTWPTSSTYYGNITVTAGGHGPNDGAANCQWAG